LGLRDDLRSKGIPEEEIDRIEQNPSEIIAYPDWPPKITGEDKQAEILLTPIDTGYPPDKPYEPYLAEPTIDGPVHYPPARDNQQGAADATATPEGESQPSIHHEEGHQGALMIPQDWGVNTQNENLQFPFLWDISDDGTMKEETSITQDSLKKIGSKRKKQLNQMEDLSLPEQLEKLDLQYHEPDGPPHVVTKPADSPDRPHMVIDEPKLKEDRPMDQATHDRDGKFVKKGTTNMDVMTDLKLPEQLEKSSEEYHDPDGTFTIPVRIVDDDEVIPVSIDEPLEQEAIDEEKKRKDWLKKIAPWLALIGSGLILEEILLQPKLEIQARYVYTGHEFPEICEGFNGKIYNLLDKTNRPVPPSESLGFTNTHPNCKCYWEMITLPTKTDKSSKAQKKHIKHVNSIVGQRAKAGTLHTVKPDGSLSQRTRSSNPRHETIDYNRIIETHVIREAIMDLRQEFKWMTKKYESAIKQLPVEGQWYIIRASTSTITDHRSEGEPYRRLLSADELHALTRTAIGKEMDVNHDPAFKTQAHIYDAEFDKMRGESQMLVLEQDPEIIRAIANGTISAVSINGGSPRSERIECDDNECFMVPEGVVLGELDNIALTWVVTNPSGFFYKGSLIPPAKAGVVNTKVEIF